jgi:hypothetical protein
VKPALGEAFGAEPKALAIVSQEFERRAATVAKDVDRAAQRIFPQRVATQGGQPLYAFPKVNGLHGEKDATLGRELEH